jgi:ATP-dependent RNA helicase RhlE
MRALVNTPSRELAAQVAQSVQNYSRYMNIRCAAVFSGVRIEPQISVLQCGCACCHARSVDGPL